MQTCLVTVSNKRFILLSVYWPPSTNIDVFVDELSAVIDEVIPLEGRLLLLGYFNCPGDSSTVVDDKLTNVLSEFDLKVSNSLPTRRDAKTKVENLLDLLIEPASDPHLTSVTTTVLSKPFDHHLVTAC